MVKIKNMFKMLSAFPGTKNITKKKVQTHKIKYNQMWVSFDL